MRVAQRDAEPGRLGEHLGARVVVEPPSAVGVRVALERAALQLRHLVLQGLEGGLGSRRGGRVADHLRDAPLRAGELVHQVARLGHAHGSDREAVRQAAENPDRRVAVDEHVLDVLPLADPLRAGNARMQIGTEVEEAGVGGAGRGEVDVVLLHVDDEGVLLVEPLARGVGVVAVHLLHRQRGRLARLIEPVDLVQHGERDGRGRRGAQELRARHAVPLRTRLGLLDDELRGEPLLVGDGQGTPLPVGHGRNGKGQQRLVVVGPLGHRPPPDCWAEAGLTRPAQVVQARARATRGGSGGRDDPASRWVRRDARSGAVTPPRST